MKFARYILLAALATTASVANAAVIRVADDAFTADAGLITFSEFAMGTVKIGRAHV